MSGTRLTVTTYVTIDGKDHKPDDQVTVADAAYAKRLVRDGNARYADDKKTEPTKPESKTA